MANKTCSYCGKAISKRAGNQEREHVFPKCLYPDSKNESKVQRLTIPSCHNCNNSWSDDEAQFLNVLAVAGDPSTSIQQEIWNGPIQRSFDEQPDSSKRVSDLYNQMETVQIDGQDRSMIFPVRDPRVLRVVRKIVRGLCYYHQVLSPVSDQQVWVEPLKYAIPPGYAMEYYHRERDIAEYWYEIFDEEEIQSVWIISFYNQVKFIARVSKTMWNLSN